WSDPLATESFTDDGVLMIMHFRILEDCEAGDVQIGVTFNPGDLVDCDLEKQSFSAVSGTVKVEADEGSETNAGEDKNGSNDDENYPDVSGYNAFLDLEPTGWYRSYVEFMLKNGYMNGMSANEIAPNGNVTRGQLVTILYRIAGSPDVSGTTNPFKDVEIGKWYTDAVIWAAANGIVNGVTTETFAPNNNITREQLATILYRYDGAKKSGANDLSKFADSQTVSAYAVDAMNWAVGTGIMNGSDGKLLPAASASRVQTAAMLSRYVENETIIPVPTDPTVSDS
ncbi:MAG: S-layer homology domain-containing protein, partial [Oscillospiraceae bacterium]|nr:S-layer homology domain-containing protein [Oscillospiraceae bacterium]